MKLIKITNDHYVVVDDEPIESGDFVYVDCSELEVRDIRKVCDYYNEQYLFEGGGQIHIDYCKRITHTTDININELYYIPLEEVKELISEVDIEKKARENASMCEDDWEDGYNQALEDNKDKKYTEEDMYMLAAFVVDAIAGRKYNFMTTTPKMVADEFIKTLQPKTEWEIEEIDGKFKLK